MTAPRRIDIRSTGRAAAATRGMMDAADICGMPAAGFQEDAPTARPPQHSPRQSVAG